LGNFLDAFAGSKTDENIHVIWNSTFCNDATPALLRGKLTQEKSCKFSSGPSCMAANPITPAPAFHS